MDRRGSGAWRTCGRRSEKLVGGLGAAEGASAETQSVRAGTAGPRCRPGVRVRGSQMPALGRPHCAAGDMTQTLSGGVDVFRGRVMPKGQGAPATAERAR